MPPQSKKDRIQMPTPAPPGHNIQPQVEDRVTAARAVLSPSARRQQESGGVLGHLLLCCLADEAIARYHTTQEPGLVVYWTNSHAMHYVPLDQVGIALAPAVDSLPALTGAKKMATVDALLWTVDPTHTAVVAICEPLMGIAFLLVSLQERASTTRPSHRIEEPHPPAILPATLLIDWPPGVTKEVVFARELKGDTVCYSVVSPQLGSLGRIIVTPVGKGQIAIRAEFLNGDPDARRETQREAAFRSVIAAIDRYLQTPRPAKETP
jgi:hypothetical protein